MKQSELKGTKFPKVKAFQRGRAAFCGPFCPSWAWEVSHTPSETKGPKGGKRAEQQGVSQGWGDSPKLESVGSGSKWERRDGEPSLPLFSFSISNICWVLKSLTDLRSQGETLRLVKQRLAILVRTQRAKNASTTSLAKSWSEGMSAALFGSVWGAEQGEPLPPALEGRVSADSGQETLTCNPNRGGAVQTAPRVKLPAGSCHRGPSYCEIRLQKLEEIPTVNIREKPLAWGSGRGGQELSSHMPEHAS